MKDAHTELQELFDEFAPIFITVDGEGIEREMGRNFCLDADAKEFLHAMNAFALQLGKDGFSDSRDTKEIEWEPGVINEGKNTVNKYKDIAEYEPSIKQIK